MELSSPASMSSAVSYGTPSSGSQRGLQSMGRPAPPPPVATAYGLQNVTLGDLLTPATDLMDPHSSAVWSPTNHVFYVSSPTSPEFDQKPSTQAQDRSLSQLALDNTSPFSEMRSKYDADTASLRTDDRSLESGIQASTQRRPRTGPPKANRPLPSVAHFSGPPTVASAREKPSSYSSTIRSNKGMLATSSRADSIRQSLEELNSAGVTSYDGGASLTGTVTSEVPAMDSKDYRIRVLTLELERCLRRAEAAEASAVTAQAALAHALAEANELARKAEYDAQQTKEATDAEKYELEQRRKAEEAAHEENLSNIQAEHAKEIAAIRSAHERALTECTKQTHAAREESATFRRQCEHLQQSVEFHQREFERLNRSVEELQSGLSLREEDVTKAILALQQLSDQLSDSLRVVQKQCDLAVDVGSALDAAKPARQLLANGEEDGLVLTPQPKFTKLTGFTRATIDRDVAVLSERIAVVLKVVDELRIRALEESTDTMNAIRERDTLVKEKEAWLEDKRRILDEQAAFDRERSTLIQNLQDAMKASNREAVERATATERNSNLYQDIAKLRLAAAESAKAFELLKSSSAQEVAELKQAMDGLGARNNELEHQRNFAAKEISALKQRLAEIEATVASAQARESDAKQALQQLQRERDAFQTEADSHKQMITELRSQSLIAAEVPQLRVEIERLVAETRKLKLDVDSAARRTDTDRDVIARKDVIIERLQLEKAAIEAAVSTLQVESKQLRDQAGTANTKLQEASVKSAIVDVLNSRIAELKAQLDMAQRSKESQQSQVDSLNREMNDAKSELRSCKAELDDARQKLSQQVSLHSTQLQTTKAAMESERRRCETMESTINRLEAELSAAKKSTNTASEELLHRALAAEAEARKQGILAQQAQHALELAQKDTARLRDAEGRLKRDAAELQSQLQNARLEASKWRKEMHALQVSSEEARIRAEAAERELSSSRLLASASPQKPITVRQTHDDSDSDGGSAWKDRAVTLAAECEWMKGRVMELEASVVDKTNELLSVSAQLDATLRRADALEAHVSELEASQSQILSASMRAPSPASFHTPTRRFVPQEPPSTIQSIPSGSLMTLRAPPPVPAFHSVQQPHPGYSVPTGMVQLGHGGGWIHVGPAASPSGLSAAPMQFPAPSHQTHPLPRPSLQSPGIVEKPQRSHRHAV